MSNYIHKIFLSLFFISSPLVVEYKLKTCCQLSKNLYFSQAKKSKKKLSLCLLESTKKYSDICLKLIINWLFCPKSISRELS